MSIDAFLDPGVDDEARVHHRHSSANGLIRKGNQPFGSAGTNSFVDRVQEIGQDLSMVTFRLSFTAVFSVFSAAVSRSSMVACWVAMMAAPVRSSTCFALVVNFLY